MDDVKSKLKNHDLNMKLKYDLYYKLHNK